MTPCFSCICREVKEFKPDIIHVTSPGVMMLAARLYAWRMKLPLVQSYHTHLPSFAPKYGMAWLVPAIWFVLRFLHAAAHLTLTTSNAMRDELNANRAVSSTKVQVTSPFGARQNLRLMMIVPPLREPWPCNCRQACRTVYRFAFMQYTTNAKIIRS